MKTAVSIPDELFAKAERLARRLGMSRSALYQRALDEFVRKSGEKSITAAINAALKDVKQEPDLFLKRAARKQFRKLHRMEKGE